MLKIVAAAATALFVTASPIAHAQTPPAATPERLKVTDQNTLTDLRIDLVKAALQLTPDQQKYWPAVESAIRGRAEDRKARLSKIAETVGKRADENPVEVMRNRDPIAFLQRRSEALAQRSADLDKLAEAWQPLYKTLSPEQRQRMAALAIFVLHDMSDAVERRRAQTDNDDWDVGSRQAFEQPRWSRVLASSGCRKFGGRLRRGAVGEIDMRRREGRRRSTTAEEAAPV